MNYWLSYSGILIAGLLLLAGGLVLIHRRWRSSAFKTFSENLLTVLVTLFIAIMALECYFKLFFAQTDSFSFTLANRNWFDRYWQVNSLDYRDREWTAADLKGKHGILVVGDSFTAGYGIRDPEERFSNVLGRQLGDDYVVMNAGRPSANTADEIRSLIDYPFAVETVILQYFINDIREAAARKDAWFHRPMPEPWPLLRPLIDHSHVLNFFYWRLARIGPASWDNTYLDWLRNTYADPEIWPLHRQQLEEFRQQVAARNARLLVVVFPSLVGVEESRGITGKVVAAFRDMGVPVLDLTDRLSAIPSREMVVNSVDAHPNEQVHRLVGEALTGMIMQTATSSAGLP